MGEVREADWKASNKKFPSFKMPAARTATRFAKDAAELASKAAQKQADKVLGIHGHSKAKKAETLTLIAQEAEDAAMRAINKPDGRHTNIDRAMTAAKKTARKIVANAML